MSHLFIDAQIFGKLMLGLMVSQDAAETFTRRLKDEAIRHIRKSIKNLRKYRSNHIFVNQLRHFDFQLPVLAEFCPLPGVIQLDYNKYFRILHERSIFDS